MTKAQWKEAERPLTDTPEGQDLYNLLLGNIEKRTQEGEAMHKESYEEVN